MSLIRRYVIGEIKDFELSSKFIYSSSIYEMDNEKKRHRPITIFCWINSSLSYQRMHVHISKRHGLQIILGRMSNLVPRTCLLFLISSHFADLFFVKPGTPRTKKEWMAKTVIWVSIVWRDNLRLMVRRKLLKTS